MKKTPVFYIQLIKNKTRENPDFFDTQSDVTALNDDLSYFINYMPQVILIAGLTSTVFSLDNSITAVYY